MPFAPFWLRLYCTVVANPRTPTAARMRVTPPPMFVSSSAVMSWRMVVKVLVRQGPVQFAPPSYERYKPSFVPATTLLLLFGSTRTFTTMRQDITALELKVLVRQGPVQ